MPWRRRYRSGAIFSGPGRTPAPYHRQADRAKSPADPASGDAHRYDAEAEEVGARRIEEMELVAPPLEDVAAFKQVVVEHRILRAPGERAAIVELLDGAHRPQGRIRRRGLGKPTAIGRKIRYRRDGYPALLIVRGRPITGIELPCDRAHIHRVTLRTG